MFLGIEFLMYACLKQAVRSPGRKCRVLCSRSRSVGEKSQTSRVLGAIAHIVRKWEDVGSKFCFAEDLDASIMRR